MDLGKKAKINLGIVIFNPSKDNVASIKQLCKLDVWNKVFVYRNSPLDCFLMSDNLELLGSGINDGLSKPYNVFIDKSLDADYLCLMDQDSIFDKDSIHKMIDYINNAMNDENVGLIAPRSYAAVSKRVERKDDISYAKYVINSGSFLNINYIIKNKLRYDEKIFLDGVDFDFCWQIRNNHGKVLIYENSVLLQELGTNEGKAKCGHSPQRYYYISSSRRYIYQKNKGKCAGFIISLLKTISNILKIILFEKSKFLKIKKCLEGQFSKL